MFIANFTPDVIEWMHVGVTGYLKPDDIEEFDDKRGRHILNKWGARGLLRMDFRDGDKEDEKRVEAMRTYTRFWGRHIEIFNQHNNSLENENKPYVHPSLQTEEKAKEFGIKLVGPWKLSQPTAGADAKELEAVKAQVSELKGMVTQLSEITKDAIQQRDNALIGQFNNLDATEFKEWTAISLAEIRQWPEGVQALVRSKWEATQGSETYPLTA